MYFVGFAISSGFVPRIADRFGRKKPYMWSLTLQLIAYVVIYYSTSLDLTIFCYLLVGFQAGGRVAIGTMYLSELVPLASQ